MEALQIKNIETLVPLDRGSTIIHQEVERLSISIGENLGSLMLRLILTVRTPNGTEKIHLVVKTPPPNEVIQEIFQTQLTFRNEIEFYRTIVPLLQDFQRENGISNVIDFQPKYYGARLNLDDDGTKPIDLDAALVLENLQCSGYGLLDRMSGVDLEAAKLVIENLAQFHAVPLALKIKRPTVFDQKIKPYLLRRQQSENQFLAFRKNLLQLFDQVEELKPFKDRALAAFEKFREQQEPGGPFATITHNDCWTNNSMYQLEGGTVVKSKLVDYQLCEYGSPARDIVFFLYSSVKPSVLEKHYDDFLTLYHTKFVSVLKELKCGITDFSFEALKNEIDFEAKHSQFGHLAFMFFPLFAPKKDMTDFNMEQLANHVITDLHKEKFIYFITDFAKRNWI